MRKSLILGAIFVLYIAFSVSVYALRDDSGVIKIGTLDVDAATLDGLHSTDFTPFNGTIRNNITVHGGMNVSEIYVGDLTGDFLRIWDDNIHSSSGLVQMDNSVTQIFAPTAQAYLNDIITLSTIEAQTADGHYWLSTWDGFDISLINGSFVSGLTDRYMDFFVLDNSGAGWAHILRMDSNGNVTMYDGGWFASTKAKINEINTTSISANSVNISGVINATDWSNVTIGTAQLIGTLTASQVDWDFNTTAQISHAINTSAINTTYIDVDGNLTANQIVLENNIIWLNVSARHCIKSDTTGTNITISTAC